MPGSLIREQARMNELLELEQQGWKALSMGGNAGRNFYASVLREDAVMLFPGGIRIEGRERVLQSFDSQPWETSEIHDPLVVTLAPNVATLLYRVEAQRQGSKPYVALVGSTYVRDRVWRMVIHQQTPV